MAPPQEAVGALAAGLQQSLTKAFGSKSSPYDRVGVLVLCWAEDDFPISCRAEALKVANILESGYCYEVETFLIPVQNSRASQNALEAAVVGFKQRYDMDGEANLMIVYYSGHADPDEHRGKAVWTARRAGEPRVDWFQVQPMLFRCRCDVLLVLDCCHASLATKGRDEGRLEVIAATDDAGWTPRPGPQSFTHFLVEILQGALQENKAVRVLEVQKLLNERACRNPFYINMRDDPKSSILLSPLPDRETSTDSRAPTIPDPLASLTFTVSLGETLSLTAIREIGDWLKNTAPSLIMRVNVDRVVDLSAGIQEFAFGRDASGVEGRLIDSCDDNDRSSFLSLVKGLALDVGEARARMTATDVSTADADDQQPARVAAEAWSKLDDRVNRVFRALLCLISGHSSFQEPDQLKALLSNETAGRAGLVKPLQLSLVAINPDTLPRPSPTSCSVRFDRLCSDGDVYVTGWHENGERLIVELVPGNELESDLWRTQTLLSQPIPESLRIAQCVGVITEPTTRRRGLVFSPGCSFQSAARLVDVFGEDAATPPLEHRFRIAYELALSLQAIHLVRWVHKGVRASNVLILRGNDGSLEPYLLGFRMSREGVEGIASLMLPEYRAEHLIYLPGSRWGNPREKFTYQHDVYAMGILLLEIGLWASWRTIDPRLKRPRITYDTVRSHLAEICRGYLTEAMGTRYATVVAHCLDDWDGGQGKAKTRMDYEKEVVSVLQELWAALSCSPQLPCGAFPHLNS
ncbi:hypothetical protein B0H67DRAFT_642672 [Lasiosphaeris hirsuta]|uniref:Protein kinase domain-containing protein n=1 Tax=Lasiosphaeris hirsuta TaxID=260670 RepID=A0AA40ANX4_9PEZI|nr:hypothetical protein B0H67DRAFT_642672 [Lasiosphaeris hirsuta]